MTAPFLPSAPPLVRMADGTIKQVSPLTGTQVWTVPGRGHKPGATPVPAARAGAPIDRSADGSHCPLCSGRCLETPPEKARLVLADPATRAEATWADPATGADPAAIGGLADGPSPEGAAPAGIWRTLRDTPAEQLFATDPEFRRIPNLFEILSYTYWQQNYGYELPPAAAAHMAAYLDSAAGREHVLAVARTRLLAGGMSHARWQELSAEAKLAPALAFFGGGHELIVARRHFPDHATTDDALASSGDLTPEEHYRFIAFTIDALRLIYRGNRYARYVAVFQNWGRPAGASFDHLHKQLAAIDERGVQVEQELARLRHNPNLYNDQAVNLAGYENLIFAENDHAVAFAGFGHRYPTLEVYSKSVASRPWEHSTDEIRGVSDLLHACHAATGPAIPSNEEWHHQPIDVEVPMPWRIVLKWRVSTLAGFEGGTKIYLNTIDPWALRDRIVSRLYQLRDTGGIAAMRIATECRCAPNSLRYNSRG